MEASWKENYSQTLRQALQEWDVPSVAAGVLQNGEVLFADGFSQSGEIPAPNAETLFQIGSCTKAFTSVAAILADRGVLDLDEPVCTYLPEFRLRDEYAGRHVTARDLLCHRSGLPRHEYAWYGTDFTREALVHNLQYLEPSVELRSEFQYNNLGYVVVGYLIERLSGKTWEEFVSDELLAPLGMTRTFLYLDDMEQDGNRMRPFDRPVIYAESGLREIDLHRTPVEDRARGVGAPYGPAGSIISCVRDMLKWAAFQMGDGTLADGRRIISAERMEDLHRPHLVMTGAAVPGRIFQCYGLGWSCCMYHGRKELFHTGAIDGFTTALYLIPSLQFAVVANVNMTNCLFCEAAAAAAVNAVMGLTNDWFAFYHTLNNQMFAGLREYAASVRGVPRPDAPPVHDADELTGTYRVKGYNDLVIRRENGVLSLELNGFRSALSHFHYDVYQLEGYIGELPPGLTVQFLSGSDGRIDRLEIPLVADPGVKPIVFTRSMA